VPNPKEIAGRRAAELVEDGMRLGFGTGSTVQFTLQRLAERVREEGLRIEGVPTSLETERTARELGLALLDLDRVEALDLTIDGADEVDGEFNLIKGGGGALLREKVVASITRREAIVIGQDKLVERLGVRFLLPIEVVPFARPVVKRALERLGAQTNLRLADARKVYRTDNGNEILDCRFPGGIADPKKLERELAQIPGVVESGLFVGLAHVLVIGHENGEVELRQRPG
jgi:ribose 5-phosphate isomerase A